MKLSLLADNNKYFTWDQWVQKSLKRNWKEFRQKTS